MISILHLKKCSFEKCLWENNLRHDVYASKFYEVLCCKTKNVSCSAVLFLVPLM